MKFTHENYKTVATRIPCNFDTYCLKADTIQKSILPYMCDIRDLLSDVLQSWLTVHFLREKGEYEFRAISLI